MSVVLNINSEVGGNLESEFGTKKIKVSAFKEQAHIWSVCVCCCTGEESY